MRMTHFPMVAWSALVLCLATSMSVACGGDDDAGDGDAGDGDMAPDPGETGSVCEAAEDCYPDVEEGELAGDAICLDRIDEGYCTHECTADEDCGAAEGECDEDVNQVCAPFESSGMMMCFLSCENQDVGNDDRTDDANEFCQLNVGTDFICRSTGGGADNRRVCVPADCDLGSDCGADEDCPGDLECDSEYLGGYCTVSGCEADADCPQDSACVAHPDRPNTCMKVCDVESTCTLCRSEAAAGVCTDEIELVESTGVTVCAPESL